MNQGQNKKAAIQNQLPEKQKILYDDMAEHQGFEPWHRLPGLTDFESVPFNRLGNAPYYFVLACRVLTTD